MRIHLWEVVPEIGADAQAWALMARPHIPANRVGDPWKITPILLFCVVAATAALATIEGPFEGVLSDVPYPVARAIHTAALLMSGIVLVLGVRWALEQRFGRRRPVISFDSDRMIIRSFDPPFTWAARREEVRSVHLRDLGGIADTWLRFGPLVVVDLTDGTSRRLPPYFDGKPEDLARDITAWAALDSRSEREHE